ncbi:MAG: hypothetical protein HYR48_01160 [Gemmatimonadetes bacterium]|nr:hypothetical protein [Gemmatimonadota bacterium]
MRAHRHAPLALLATAIVLGCTNAGEGRVLSITATGKVAGTVYFDVDGSRTNNFGDTNLAGIGILLFTRGTRDTVARVISNGSGAVVLTDIPVGSYTVGVDPATVGAMFELVSTADTSFTLASGDSVSITVGISYPHKTVAQARALPAGRKIFVEGIALNARSTFSDTTVHLADTSGAIRATRVRSTPFFVTADSVRFLGTTSARDGQPTLDDVTPLVLFPEVFLPNLTVITTGVAASANAGRLDAALVQIDTATIGDTIAVADGMQLLVNDGTGSLEVLLDQAADPTFFPPNRAGASPPYPYVPGARFRIIGVLVPTGTAGVWRLKPRSSTDLITR